MDINEIINWIFEINIYISYICDFCSYNQWLDNICDLIIT